MSPNFNHFVTVLFSLSQSQSIASKRSPHYLFSSLKHTETSSQTMLLNVQTQKLSWFKANRNSSQLLSRFSKEKKQKSRGRRFTRQSNYFSSFLLLRHAMKLKKEARREKKSISLNRGKKITSDQKKFP